MDGVGISCKIARMSAKKQNNLFEAARDAVTGYTVVILGIICFLLVLFVIVGAVRLIVGTNSASNVTNVNAAGATTSAAAHATVSPIGSV